MIINVHGYAFGGRLLEDCYFFVTVEGETVADVQPSPGLAESAHWDDLNQPKMLGLCRTFVEKAIKDGDLGEFEVVQS